MSELLRVVLDTNVLWIGLLNTGHPLTGVCRQLLRHIDDGEVKAYASTLALVELPKVVESDLPVDKLAALEAYLRRSRIRWVQLSERVAHLAREIALEAEVKSAKDAVMLATAVVADVSKLFTADEDDFPIGSAVRGVAVSAPYIPQALAYRQVTLRHETKGVWPDEDVKP
jgi:predicted nucleic acid-binding protein